MAFPGSTLAMISYIFISAIVNFLVDTLFKEKIVKYFRKEIKRTINENRFIILTFRM